MTTSRWARRNRRGMGRREAGKTILRIAVLALAVGAAAATCGATSVAEESFSYSTGDLNGRNGGTGWAAAWVAPTAYDQVVSPSTPMSYSIPGWHIEGGSTALSLTGNNDDVVHRQLASAVSSDVWTSFLFRWQQGTVNENDFAVVWFSNSPANNWLVPNIGVKANLGDPVAGGGVEDIVVRLTMGTNDDYAGNVTVSATATHFVVGHLYKTGGSAQYNAFEMWVDPDAANLVGDRNASRFVYAIDNTGSTTLQSFSLVGMRTYGLGTNDVLLFDEFSFGTTMQDVLGDHLSGDPPMVPEPVTLAAVVLGLGALARYARRRRMA